MSSHRYCSNCGALVAHDATFCSICGSALKPQISTSPQPPDSIQNLLHLPYTPKRLVEPLVSAELSERMERALRKVKQLSYIIIGLSLIILVETLYWYGFFG